MSASQPGVPATDPLVAAIAALLVSRERGAAAGEVAVQGPRAD